jgi:hypothetical protein
VQSDFNTKLDPAFRVALTDNPSGLSLGAPVVGIRTSWGDIKNMPDVFIRDERQQTPFELRYPAVAIANLYKPATAAPVAAAGPSDTKWKTAHAGNYYYAVAGVTASGESQSLVSAQVAVAAGNKVTLTIGKSVVGTETGYAIYRGRKDGTNALSDLRFVTRIPCAGASTVWVDLNRKIPGTTKAFILNMSPGAMAINWRQFLPMTKFALYPTNSPVVPWAQMLFGYLRLGKRRHHTVIENIVATGQLWKPFG